MNMYLNCIIRNALLSYKILFIKHAYDPLLQMHNLTKVSGQKAAARYTHMPQRGSFYIDIDHMAVGQLDQISLYLLR